MEHKFGERLKVALKKAGYSQKSATEKLGLSKNALTNYVAGRIPEALILYNLSQLCSVSMEWLLTGKEEFDESLKVIEKKEITVTGKRQITIPKKYYEFLNIGESLEALLTADGIFLKPIKKSETTMYKDDVKSIVLKAISEGHSQDKLAEVIAQRIEEYNKLIAKRIEQFQNDMNDFSDTTNDVSYNGLEQLFDKDGSKENKSVDQKDYDE